MTAGVRQIPAIDKPIETVLVTNDDGVSSPFFGPTVDALYRCGHFKKVIFVAPAEEQSWIGSAVTRFRPVFAEKLTIGSCDGFVVTGTPSDCVYLGLQNLFATPPDLVISGINLGTNTGRAFALSSGTVSGALAAFLGGCRSVAVSAKVPSPVFQRWGRHDTHGLAEFSDFWPRIADAAVLQILKLIEAGIWRFADVPAVDLPWETTESTPARITRPAATHYTRVFEQVAPDCYRHQFSGLTAGDPLGRNCRLESDSDIEAVTRGEISINLLSYSLTGGPHLEGVGDSLIAARNLLEKKG